LAKTRKSTKQQSKSGISPTLIILVIVAAILVVGGLILLNNQSATTEVDVSGFPYLGDENAPVVMIEYSDFG
jgi:flagellar basal body-associated protein FliL